MAKSSTGTPGLKIQKQRGRLEARWRATQEACAKGFPSRSVRLHPDPWAGMTLGEKVSLYGSHCVRLDIEQREWLTGFRASNPSQYDGTMLSLSQIYQGHPDSPFHQVSSACRRNYVLYLKSIEEAVGQTRVDRLTGPDLRRWHKGFMGSTPPYKMRNAQAVMNMVRGMMRFGSELRLEGVRESHQIISGIRFPAPKKRTIFMTFEHARSVVEYALAEFLKTGKRTSLSVALGQAFQFELGLRQTDVIGVWEDFIGRPKSRPPGSILKRTTIWLPGLLWEDISFRILKGFTRKTGQEFEFDLSLYPLIQKVLAFVPREFKEGPVVAVGTHEPFGKETFSHAWRKIADKAKVPRSILNRDSRSGSVTEATDAGAPLESVRHAAQHGNIQTTAGYSRNGARKTAEVARLRVASRQAAK